MATNITSTQLDFDQIKGSLKTYLKAKSEFSDYDFEASGLNNILDVLAYNTHFNGLIANFALNESFLDTAQLRSSVVSHAEMLGLDVSSKTSSQVTLRASINLSNDANRPTAVVLPAGANFSTTIDGNTFQFFTRRQYTAIDANGLYTFATSTGVQEIIAYEGVTKNKTFFVGETADRQVYVIPDKNIDVKTATVTVFNSVTSTDNTIYTELNKAVTVSAASTLYTIRETPNGFYELNFGDGVTFGKAPEAGNKIVVNYLSTSGASANGGTAFTSNTQLTVNGASKIISVTPLTNSISGADLQSIDAIKQLAPAAFATQQRLVTALDYESMIKANFPTITAVSAWGSQDNVPVDYGKVYISLGFADTVTKDEKITLKAAIENTYANNLGIMAIGTKFVDPVDIKFNLETQIQWDPNLTGLKSGNVENKIKNLIKTHFATKLNGFGKTFRRSALLTEIDAFDPSILSSKMDVKLVIDLIPLLNKEQSYKMYFPVRLEAPGLTFYSIESSSFTYGATNKIARIRNKLGSTILQIVDANSAVIVDTIGQYFTQSGLVSLNAFTPRSILDGSPSIKFTVTPADQSVIKPLRNYLLKTDDRSMQVGITVDFQNTNVVLG
jgi:hypothetical protein